jgi:hypothetical protein
MAVMTTNTVHHVRTRACTLSALALLLLNLLLQVQASLSEQRKQLSWSQMFH